MAARESASAALSSLSLNFVLPANRTRDAACGGGALLLIGSGSPDFGGFSPCPRSEISCWLINSKVIAIDTHLIGIELDTLDDPGNCRCRRRRLFANS